MERALDGEPGSLGELVGCPKCKKDRLTVTLGTVQVDHGGRVTHVRREGAATARTKLRGAHPVVNVFFTCSKGHGFHIRITPTASGEVILSTGSNGKTTPPL